MPRVALVSLRHTWVDWMHAHSNAGSVILPTSEGKLTYSGIPQNMHKNIAGARMYGQCEI